MLVDTLMNKQHPPSTLEDLTTPPPTLEPPPSRARRRKTWIWLLVLVLLGVGVYFARGKKGAPSASNATATPAGGRPRGFGAIPVVAARAQKGNIGVYYTGLGAVTPIYGVFGPNPVKRESFQSESGRSRKAAHHEADLRPAIGIEE